MYTNSMRRCATILAIAVLGCCTEPALSTLQIPFSLEELIPLRQEFYPDRVSVDWISGHEYIDHDADLGIRKYDAETDSYVTLLDPLELYNLSGYAATTFSNNLKYLLLSTNRRKIYRYSSIAEYAIYNLENKSLTNLAEGWLQAVVWGGERSLAYVQNNNVYYVPDVATPDVVTTLTDEGVPGEVYFGATDWIYEEEIFNAAEALWFSPEGTFLAVASFNDTLVESTVFPIYGNPADVNFQYPQEVRFKYPKAGRANPLVGVRVFKVKDPKTDAWHIPAPVNVVGLDHILGRVNWASEHNLLVLWMNRRQNIAVLASCDLSKDKCTIVRQRNEPTGWIDVNQPFFDETGNHMIEIEPQVYEDRRWLHAAKFYINNNTIEDLTPMNATVTEVLGWNEEKATLYYILTPPTTPWLSQMWATSKGNSWCVSCSITNCPSASAMFSPKTTFGLLTCSATNTPHKSFLYNAKSNKFKLLKDNAKLVERLNRYKLPSPLFNVISLGNGTIAHVKLLLPPTMNLGEKYPMIVRVYAGPGTSRVRDSYDLEYYNMYLASNRSFISASIDVRGSGVMGVENMYAINNALGTYEVTDTLAAIKRLIELHPFIDPERIGVWGWSYGGFVTTSMLEKDTEKVVACGIAVAPVTSWLFYDSIYTERYMDLPQYNIQSYQQSDLMVAAEKLRGRKFMLVHGTGDDNVHYQHSLQLAKVLQHADIAFEQMSYTDESHSLLGVSRHFYHTLDHFWTDCFAGNN